MDRKQTNLLRYLSFYSIMVDQERDMLEELRQAITNGLEDELLSPSHSYGDGSKGSSPQHNPIIKKITHRMLR